MRIQIEESRTPVDYSWTAEKGCLRAQIHNPGVKIQQLAILGCAHGLVFFGTFHANQ